MEEVKRKGSNDLVVLAITFVILTTIIAVCYYAMNDRKLMAANMPCRAATSPSLTSMTRTLTQCSSTQAEPLTTTASGWSPHAE